MRDVSITTEHEAKMKHCTYCKLPITPVQIEKGGAHQLFEKWSHTLCDAEAMKKIDKKTKYGKPFNQFQL